MNTDQALVQQIINLDQEWAQAHLTLDLGSIANILSDDFQQIQADGSITDKRELLDSYASGNRVWEIAQSTNHQVQIWGELAIVFGNWKGKGVNNGNSFNYRARFISIYRLEIDDWKMVLDRSISESLP